MKYSLRVPALMPRKSMADSTDFIGSKLGMPYNTSKEETAKDQESAYHKTVFMLTVVGLSLHIWLRILLHP